MNGELALYSEYLSSLGQAQNDLCHIVNTFLKLINKKDDYICKHGIRTALISIAIGNSIHIEYDEISVLEQAALFHDIGKLPLLEIIRKEGSLSDAEWELIKTHATIPLTDPNGYNIKATGEKVMTAVKHHHEKINGQGYPDRLKGDEIPLNSQILAIADVFDALTSDRPYRSAYSPKKAIQIMSGPKFTGHFNQELFEISKNGALQTITL